MGMYDTILWKGEGLPTNVWLEAHGLDADSLAFQTKDLESTMDTYVVKDYQLYLQQYRISEWVQTESGEKPLWFGGRLKQEQPFLVPVENTGTVNFYDYLYDVDGKWDVMIEYQMTLDQGKVASVKLVNFSPKANTVRIEQSKSFDALREKEDALWYNRFFLNTAFVWRIRLKLRFVCYRISNFFSKLSTKL